MTPKLSVLVPSKWPDKLVALLDNMAATAANFDALEIVVCLDEGEPYPEVHYPNMKVVYEPKMPKEALFISRFFATAYRAATGDWMFLCNDDIEFLTKDWDLYLDLDNRNKYSLLYFDDNYFRSSFSCHPVCSKEAWGLMDRNTLIFDDWRNMGCDTTLWDTIPESLKVYIPEIKIAHHRYVDTAKELEMMDDYVRYMEKAYIRDAVKLHMLKENMPKDTKIAFGVVTGEYIRRAEVIPYITGLIKPDNTYFISQHGQSPSEARNIIVRSALANNCTHVFFMDDDMAIPPETLISLLQHDKDIVLGHYLMRRYPHHPVAFDKAVENGYHRFLSLHDGVHNLMEITNGGLGCALIKCDVFRKMAEGKDYKTFPWFTLGEIVPDGWSDDVAFYNRATAAGFKMYLDPRAICGHMTAVTIWPHKFFDGNWHIDYKHQDGQVRFPASSIQPKPKD